MENEILKNYIENNNIDLIKNYLLNNNMIYKTLKIINMICINNYIEIKEIKNYGLNLVITFKNNENLKETLNLIKNEILKNNKINHKDIFINDNDIFINDNDITIYFNNYIYKIYHKYYF